MEQWELDSLRKYEAELDAVTAILQRELGCGVGLLCAVKALQVVLRERDAKVDKLCGMVRKLKRMAREVQRA